MQKRERLSHSLFIVSILAFVFVISIFIYSSLNVTGKGNKGASSTETAAGSALTSSFSCQEIKKITKGNSTVICNRKVSFLSSNPNEIKLEIRSLNGTFLSSGTVPFNRHEDTAFKAGYFVLIKHFNSAKTDVDIQLSVLD